MTNIYSSDLKREYLENRRSMKEIAQMFGCGETHIWTLIHRYQIPVRERRLHLKGRRFSKTHRQNLSKAKIGKKNGTANPNWRGGVDLQHIAVRRSAEYIRWRKHALRFKGDACGLCAKDLTICCPTCGHRPDKHVHHIKDFADHPELRFDSENAMVLCEDCHLTQRKKRRQLEFID